MKPSKPKAVSKKVTIAIPCEFSNSMSLMLHEELWNGKYKGKGFRLIKSLCNRGFRLEYGDYHLDFNGKDLVEAMMYKMIESLKEQKKIK